MEWLSLHSSVLGVLCQGHSSLDDRGTDVGGKFGPFFPSSRSYIQEIVLLLISSQTLIAKQR